MNWNSMPADSNRQAFSYTVLIDFPFCLVYHYPTFYSTLAQRVLIV